ncbi:MAG: hypothetical protein ABW174_06555 [Flavitalea sp.]
MTPEKEQLYIEYWEANREREGELKTQLLVGIPVGLLFAVPVIAILFTARFWYRRADMSANSSLTPVLVIVLVVAISAFVAVIYKRHQWDMKEQQYLEFKAKQKKREQENAVQQSGN